MRERHQRFVNEYLVDLDAGRAAAVAGYVSTRYRAYASKQASKLLKRPDVRAAIAVRKGQQLLRAELTAAAVLDQLRALSMVDIREFFDTDGALKPPSKWSADMGRAVASFDVIKKNVTSGDGKSDDVFRVRLADKVRALEMLAKHFGLLVDRVDHSGAIVFQHEQLEVPVTVEAVRVPERSGEGIR
jgi:phage terminase small subunit